MYDLWRPYPQVSQLELKGELEDKSVTKVAAGDSFGVAITSDGNLYGWGSIRTAVRGGENKDMCKANVSQIASSDKSRCSGSSQGSPLPCVTDITPLP